MIHTYPMFFRDRIHEERVNFTSHVLCLGENKHFRDITSILGCQHTGSDPTQVTLNANQKIVHIISMLLQSR